MIRVDFDRVIKKEYDGKFCWYFARYGEIMEDEMREVEVEVVRKGENGEERVKAVAVLSRDRVDGGTVLYMVESEVELNDEELREIAKAIEGNMIVKYEAFAEIVKREEEKRLVYGIVLEPEVEDLQGDIVSAEEIESAAHRFMAEYMKIDKMHDWKYLGKDKVAIVESYIAPVDFRLGGEVVRKGSWVMAVKVFDDELWEEIKKGKINGFSVAGYGRREREEKGGNMNWRWLV